MKNEIVIQPIAHIRSDFQEKFGIPRQSGRAPSLLSKIVFTPEYRIPEALREIDGFSHLWLLFDFSLTRGEGWNPTVRPPRLGGNKRVGVFASRSPFRPNHIGLSCVKLVGIEHSANEGDILLISGADLLDGTPIFDIKPYLPFADCIQGATAGYASQGEYHQLEVQIPDGLLQKIPQDKRQGLLECLADDPRPAYKDEPTRVYGMAFGGLEIKFTVNESVLTVVDIL